MAVKIAPDARRQFVNASGVPYSGAKLFYYASGSSTKQNTYTTSVGSVANSNPIVLDSAGRTPYGVWLTAGLTYKEVLAPSTDTDPPGSPIYTEDGISGINDTAVTVSQWGASALTPTYISGTSFSVAGDQTSELHIGRRLQLSVTAGTVYARISNSVYGALTTVTVVMDSGSLDSGLSSFNWSILTATNHALPKLSSASLTAIGIANTTAYAPLSSPTFTGTVALPIATVSSTLTASSTLTVIGKLTPSQTNGIVGTTTDNNAVAGSVGEVIESNVQVGSAVSLTSGATSDVTSIVLTPGDWDVTGNAVLKTTATTSVTFIAGSITTVAATHNSNNGFRISSPAHAPGTADLGGACPARRIQVATATTTTVYLNATGTFTVSTLVAYGYVSARRAR